MNRHVLSINGNTAMNYLLKTGFSDKYNVTTVANVFDALQELRNNEKIEMVILDIDYHTEECVDFVQHLNSSTLYSCPVILLGSVSNKAVAENLGQHRDVRESFIKPFDPANLSKSIDDFVALNLAS
ncbi:MAG: response regulator [Bacteroidota bacterium]|nr:response regulator [Bacteroidota bacterium]